MMGNPSGNKKVTEGAAQRTPNKPIKGLGPHSPAIPSDIDIQMSPIAISTGAGSTDFGSTPTKSYSAFPRTPQQQQHSAIVLEAPSSRLRHSITVKKALSDQPGTPNDPNLSFDMGDVEMMTSADNLNHLTTTPFSKIGQANYVTLKEQEKVNCTSFLFLFKFLFLDHG